MSEHTVSSHTEPLLGTLDKDFLDEDIYGKQHASTDYHNGEGTVKIELRHLYYDIPISKGVIESLREAGRHLVRMGGRLSAAPQPSRRKQILKDVSGIIYPKQLVAIMGPTGCGKTSLLDVISGRKASAARGQVLINGAFPDSFDMCGYVVQDTPLIGTLTVKECLMFSADLRLNMSKSQRRRRVQQCMEDMQLEGAAETMVGTDVKRGLSGGEKKRLCIGLELLTRPACLLLDEPTSGLDAATALSITGLFERLADKGHSIIATVHAPRFQVFQKFARVFLLAKGEVVFHGATKDLLPFFESVGFHCPTHDNPADFVLDVITGSNSFNASVEVGTGFGTSSGNGSIQAMHGGKEGEVPGRSGQDERGPQREEEKEDDRPTDDLHLGAGGSAIAKERTWDEERGGSSTVSVLVSRYRASAFYEAVLAELTSHGDALGRLPLQEERDEGGASHGKTPNGQKVSALTKLTVVCGRTILVMLRSREIFFLQMMICTFLGLILGLIYYNQKRTYEGLQNISGLCFFVIINVVFLNLGAVTLFLNERPVFFNERANGYYDTLTYWIAKVFCDFIPLRIIPLSVLSTLIYFMSGFRYQWDHYLLFMVIVISTSLAGAALCFASSSFASSYVTASQGPALLFVFMLLFGGVFIKTDTLPKQARWLENISIFHYAYEGMLANEVRGLTYECGDSDPKLTGCPITGEEFLSLQGFGDRANIIEIDIAVLLAFAAGFFSLSLVGLYRSKWA